MIEATTMTTTTPTTPTRPATLSRWRCKTTGRTLQVMGHAELWPAGGPVVLAWVTPMNAAEVPVQAVPLAAFIETHDQLPTPELPTRPRPARPF